MSVTKTIGLPEEGGFVSWEVSAPHYTPQSANNIEVHQSVTEYVNLSQMTYSIVFYINPSTATLKVNGSIRPETGFRRVISGFHYGDEVTFEVSQENYMSVYDTIIVEGNMEIIVNIDESALTKHTFTIHPLPNFATVLINGVQRTSAELVEGTTVSWSVSAENYITQSGSLVLMDDVSMNVNLVWNGRYTFSINPDPSNATVILNGEQRQSITVYDGDVVEWSVSAPGYETLSGVYSVTCDYTLNVHLISTTSEMLTFKVTAPGNLYWINTGNHYRGIQYSINGREWTNTGNNPIYLAENDEITFKGVHHYYGPSVSFSHGYTGHMCFSNAENGEDDGLRFEVRGDIRSLVGGDNYQNVLSYDEAGYTYTSLFEGCGGVIDASRLTFGGVHPFGCDNMFKGCINLVNPSTDSQAWANSMYEGCTRLTSTPPYLKRGGYLGYNQKSMFKNCVSLKLASYGLFGRDQGYYVSLFEGCTRLTSSPAIDPASRPSNFGFLKDMFKGCSALNRITCMIVGNESLSEPITISNWVYGVGESGLFIKSPDANWSVGDGGIPTDWVVSTTPPTFTFSIVATPTSSDVVINGVTRSSYNATPGETITWSVSKTGYISQSGTYTMGYGSHTENVALIPDHLKFVPDNTGYILWKGDEARTIEYSTDKTNWTSVTCTNVGNRISVNQGVPVYFRGSLDKVSPARFVIDTSQGTVGGTISGNVNSLIDEELGILSGCFSNVFSDCVSMRNHVTEDILLPLTTLPGDCYNSMFYNCTSLTRAAVMSATTGASSCCHTMYSGCTSLETSLPITMQPSGNYSFQGMFYGCTAMVTAPDLRIPAIMSGSANNICESMFEDCTSLTSIYISAVVNYGSHAFDYLCSGCSSLNKVTCLITGVSQYRYTNWMRGVATTGTFYYQKAQSWPRGANGIPSAWTAVGV